jgi:hypothetical protein
MVKVELIRGLISICATFPVHFGNLKDACWLNIAILETIRTTASQNPNEPIPNQSCPGAEWKFWFSLHPPSELVPGSATQRDKLNFVAKAWAPHWGRNIPLSPFWNLKKMRCWTQYRWLLRRCAVPPASQNLST